MTLNFDSKSGRQFIGNSENKALRGNQPAVELKNSQFTGVMRYSDDIGWIVRSWNYTNDTKSDFLKDGGFVKLTEKSEDPQFKLYIGMVFVLNGHVFEVSSIA